jgi:monofunctional biosynthetic peptidoglycan transglycosylase
VAKRARTIRARSGRSRRGARWLRWVGILAALALIVPIVQCILVRWIDPPGTPLMSIRKIEARWAERIPAHVRYQWCDYGDIPRDYLKTVLLAEDQRFFQHNGFDWKEIRAARKAAERSGTQSRGASTITMQCARSLFLWQGRSYVRKGLEAYYTFWLELFVPKRRILELYSNVTELGDGIYGIGAAARAYYGVVPKDLSDSQCVRLAALLPAPLKWSPQAPSGKYAARVARLERDLPQGRVPGFDKDRR